MCNLNPTLEILKVEETQRQFNILKLFCLLVHMQTQYDFNIDEMLHVFIVSNISISLKCRGNLKKTGNKTWILDLKYKTCSVSRLAFAYVQMIEFWGIKSVLIHQEKVFFKKAILHRQWSSLKHAVGVSVQSWAPPKWQLDALVRPLWSLSFCNLGVFFCYDRY